jgi:hypothetical protein
LSIGLIRQVWADDALLSGSDATSVGKLENKLFQHPYAKDDGEKRLARLETAIFGEPKKGSTAERITALTQAVPTTDAPEPTAHNQSSGENQSSSRSSRETASSRGQDSDESTPGSEPGNYPAVTAIEKKVLGRTYENDPVNQRLARLENQQFKKVSSSTDLSERVDALKQSTGIDIARQAPAGSDWSDDDDDMTMPASRSARSSAGNDVSFGQHDLDMSGLSGGSNPLAMGGGIPGASTRRRSSNGLSTSQQGLTQQVTAMELELLGRAYVHDTLPARVTRLETTLFPKQQPSTDQSLPQRVQKLLAYIPVAGGDDLSSLPTAIAQQQANSSQKSGLSNIISKLGNMMGGGNNGVGGYSSAGNYVIDPQTGMMIDRNTGNIINPNTGQVISSGSASAGGSYYMPSMGMSNMGMSNMGMGSFGGMGGFNNGFSPMGTPYGYGSPYGGGTGMRFGLGGGRVGMWP